MPHHACIDPLDQYAQAEVRVEFETTAGVVRLVSVRDALDEPPRVSRRLQLLRGWSHDKANPTVFP